MTFLSWFVGFILSFFGIEYTEPKPREKCIATVFGTPGDKHMGTKTACPPYVFDRTVPGIAHRTLPCGTEVVLRIPRTGKIQTARVVDRGPYGAKLPDGSWVLKVKSTDPGIWRGCVDLTPPLSKALDHNGFEQIEVFYKKKRRTGGS